MARPNIVKQYCSFKCKRNASVQRYKERWPERVKVMGKRSRKNRDKEQAAAYFQANKDKIMARRRNARLETVPARAARSMYSAAHRAKKLGLPFSVPLDVWAAMTDGTTCFYCRERPATEVDKIIPDKGYVCGNIAPACRPCNQRKNDMVIADFLRFADTLTAMGVA